MPLSLPPMTQDFIITQIEIALTYVDIAATATDLETQERNRANAKKAHDFAVLLLKKNTSLTGARRDEVEASLANLQRQIDRLT
jgi:hypothetical protein